jgi:signal recognition particle receptor subunit beta
MVQINFAQKTVNVKIVYYGPGMSGKTTNLEVVHQRAPEKNRGELTSISTDGDRTLFFDYMPLNLGTVAGMRTCFQCYTVPGQVYYNSTRKLVLQGVDGVIFVADSSSSMLDQNLESLRNLEENLNEYGKSLATLPHVLQWNKRDLPDAMSADELAKHLNHHGAPVFEAVANTGQGVFPTLKALAASVLKGIMAESGGLRAPGAAPAVPQADAAPAAPTASAAPLLDAAPPAVPAAPAAPAGAPHLDVAASALAPHDQAPASPYASNAPAQPAVQSAPQAGGSPGGLMKQKASRPQAAPQRVTRPRAKAQPSSGTAVRRARQRPAHASAGAPVKKGGVSTGVFLAVAAAVGAAIAWAAMTFLK